MLADTLYLRLLLCGPRTPRSATHRPPDEDVPQRHRDAAGDDGGGDPAETELLESDRAEHEDREQEQRNPDLDGELPGPEHREPAHGR